MSTFIADNNAYSDSESDSDYDYNGYDDIPTYQDLVVLPNRFIVSHNVVIDLSNRRIAHPDTAKEAPERQLYHSRLFYGKLFSNPNGTVIIYDCSQLIHYGVKSSDRIVSVVEGKLVVTNKRVNETSKRQEVFVIRNKGKGQVYLCPKENNQLSSESSDFAHYIIKNNDCSPDYVHTLETIYNITNFITKMGEINITTDFSEYRLEIGRRGGIVK